MISTINPLSALVPVKLSYEHGSTTKQFDSTRYVTTGGLSFYKHKAFKNLQDAALSKGNALFLTDVKELDSVFVDLKETSNITSIAGCLTLKQNISKKYLKSENDKLFLGGPQQNLLLFFSPISNNAVKIYTNNTTRLTVDENYPYDVKLSKEILNETEEYRQIFEIDYYNELLTIKHKTKEGYRYISAGSDFFIRAVGLSLNYTIVNDYLFVPEFITRSEITRGVNFNCIEVKYYNSLNNDYNNTTIDIKEQKELNTNLLISCPTTSVAKTSGDNVLVNVSILKTNFTPTGTFNSQL